MAVIETWLRQDLNRLVNVQSLQGQLFSRDDGGNLIGVKVTRDGEPVELEGTIAGYCILPDGETIDITPATGNTGIRNGNEAYVILPQLAYSIPGQISIVIKLAHDSGVTTLAACTGYVYRSRTDDEVVPPGTPIPDLHELETVIANAVAATASANTAAAAAENVDASMSKSGDVITITVTNRDGVTMTETLTDQSDDVADLNSALNLFDDIPGTVQTVTFANDKPASIVHTASGATVRTDAFTWGENSVTEVRTLADGTHITFVTNLDTLVTTISEIEEAS